MKRKVDAVSYRQGWLDCFQMTVNQRATPDDVLHAIKAMARRQLRDPRGERLMSPGQRKLTMP